MSHWRVPRSKVPSGKLQQESHQPNNSTWEYRENIDGNVDTDRRHNEESLGERCSWDTNRASGDLVGDKQRDDFRDDSGNIRHYQDNEGQYKTRDNYTYQEQTEGYYPQQWDNEQIEEVNYYEDNWNGWDSAYNGSGENVCEREKHDREEVCKWLIIRVVKLQSVTLTYLHGAMSSQSRRVTDRKMLTSFSFPLYFSFLLTSLLLKFKHVT